MKNDDNKNYWALILGASSGFGEAAAIKLAEDGFNIIGIHLDRQATMPHVDEIKKKIISFGSEQLFFNTNAADDKKREEIAAELKEKFNGKASIKVIMHSLAFGSLKPFVTNNNDQTITKAQMEMTLDVMAHSLVYWTQEIVKNNLLAHKSRIFAMTSSGGHTVIPTYGAVSAAKAALESHVRQLAEELGYLEVGVSAIMAGVTDTPALRKIPGNIPMMDVARRKNPRSRLTNTVDVAKIISILCKDGGEWISGGVIHADGGEDIVSFVGQGKQTENY
ncbi:MAG TPA: SDR family oxidoreductase [Ignavibacteriaceae bacterium]|nr:SDR family oxidoreductase [Ignavibacteriaceae bacterium]